MKILHLDTRPDWRGGQHQILLTVRGLRHLGHDAQLLTRANSLLAQRASAENIPAHTFPASFPRVQALLCLKEILHQQQFDIVHAHDPHALTAAWLARAHHRTALAASRRVAYPLTHSWPGLARYRAAHRIIAVSKFVAASVISSGIDSERVAVVYDGAEIPPPFKTEDRASARCAWKSSSSTALIGCVGYLLPEKGQEFLLRAMKEVVSVFPDCKLILAGDGPMRSHLQALAKNRALEHHVIFAGFISDTESIYRALDVFVFPSLAEPLGSSLLAAMAHGLPVVAIASGGVPEIVENGRNGMLADAPDASQLARAICELLTHPEMAARLGASARDTISKRFTASLLAENTLHEYENALAIAHRA